MNWQAKLAALSWDELRQLAHSMAIDTSSVQSKDDLCRHLKKKLKKDGRAQKLLLGFFVAHGGNDGTSSHEAGSASSSTASNDLDNGSTQKTQKRREENLLKSANDLRKELKGSKKENERLATELKKSRREAGLLGEQMATLRKEKKEYEEQIAALKRQLAAATKFHTATHSPPREANSDALFSRTQEVTQLRQEVKELRKKVSHLSRKRKDRTKQDEARLEKRKAQLEKDCKGLKEEKRRLRESSVPKGSYVGTFFLASSGGLVVAPSRADLFIDDIYVVGEQILVTPTKKGFKVRSCDGRKKEELFGVVEDREGTLFVGKIAVIGDCHPGDIVKARFFQGEERATVERVLNERDIVNRLLGKKAERKRTGASERRASRQPQPSTSQSSTSQSSKSKTTTSKPTKSNQVLIVGGDRVGSAYVDELAQRSIKASWYSGFGGLLGRERGLGGVSLVLLILSQASHTMVASVEEAARLAGCKLVKTMNRGKKKVADIIEKELNNLTSIPDDE